MYNKIVIRVAFTFLVVNLFVTSCEGLRNWGKNNNNEQEYASPQYSLFSGGLSSSSEPTGRGLGISAWGIVTVIVSLILAIMGMYFLSICYPILCKKSRNYGMIDLASVV